MSSGLIVVLQIESKVLVGRSVRFGMQPQQWMFGRPGATEGRLFVAKSTAVCWLVEGVDRFIDVTEVGVEFLVGELMDWSKHQPWLPRYVNGWSTTSGRSVD